MKPNGKATQAQRRAAALGEIKNTIWNWMASPNAIKSLSVADVHLLVATMQQIAAQLIDQAYADGAADKQAEIAGSRTAEPEQPAAEPSEAS